MLRYIFHMLAFVPALLSAQPRTWYVNADAAGAGNGANWTDAFPQLQDALQAARPGDEIWVTKGRYSPSASDSNASFVFKAGVQVLGNFEGFESDPTQRHFAADTIETVFDGQLPAGGFSRRLIHIQGRGRFFLDGCAISGGQALNRDTAAQDLYGGGILAMIERDSAELTLTRCHFLFNQARLKGGGLCAMAMGSGFLRVRLQACTFRHCRGAEGGGLHVEASGGQLALEASDCRFLHNSSEHFGLRLDGGGGAHLLSRNNGMLNAHFTNCQFEQNTSPFDGGALTAWAIENSRLSVELNACRFESNTTRENGGGGLHLRADDPDFRPYGSSASGVLRNCLFSRNSSGSDGGGLVASSRGNGKTAIQLVSCSFSNNTAPFGGAMGNSAHEAGYTRISSVNCRFSDNYAPNAAGVLRNSTHRTATASGLFTNCLFERNSAGRMGAAIWNDDSTTDLDTLVFIHCTFYRNRSPRDTWFVDQAGVRYARFLNCLMESNLAAGLSPESHVDVTHCMLEPAFPGIGNQTGIPDYQAPDLGDFRPAPESPGIDAGLLSADLPPTDLAGNPRIVGPAPDLGAYELPAANAPGPAGLLQCRAPATLPLLPETATCTVPDRSLDPVLSTPDVGVTNDFTGTSTLEGARFPPGIYRVLWRAENQENTATCVQKITVASSVLSPNGVRTTISRQKN